MNINRFININDWMNARPYKKQAAYDRFYLEVWRGLFSVLSEVSGKMEEWPEDQFSADENKDLAWILTGYFEDRVNGFGFWEEVVKQHQGLYGKRIPFYTIEALALHDGEDIQPADVHFLVYTYHLFLLDDGEDRQVMDFRLPYIIALTEAACHYFDSIKEVETTDFFNIYLVPDKDYILFKAKLDWFVFKSYLFSLDFSERVSRYIIRLKEEKADLKTAAPILYEYQDGLLFEHPATSFSALLPVDVFAGILHCSDDKKAEVRNLKFRAYGIYEVKNNAADTYSFMHTGTGEQFDVLKSSFNQSMLKEELSGYFLTHVVRWNGSHSISGMCLSVPGTAADIKRKNLINQHAFQKHFTPYRQNVEDIAKRFSRLALEFFGSRLIPCANGRELQQKWNEFMQYYSKEIAKEDNTESRELPDLSLEANLVNDPDEVTIFVEENDNLSFRYEHKELLQFLQNTDELKVAESKLMYYRGFFTEEASEAYWRCLRQQYTLPNLHLLTGCPVEEEADFSAALRIYQPASFSPLLLPAFSIGEKEDLHAAPENF